MATATSPSVGAKRLETIDTVVIRFAGDSGDGMQLTGTQFTNTSAAIGNDLATLPDFPAEIRAPAGTLPGVSGFQINFSSNDIYTPGDAPDVLVAMNPAALKINIADLRINGVIIVNTFLRMLCTSGVSSTTRRYASSISISGPPVSVECMPLVR